MEVWKTQSGKEIKYSELEDRHLLNIIRFVHRKMIEGHLLVTGFAGSCIGDHYYEEEIIHGSEVADYFNLKGLQEEFNKRYAHVLSILKKDTDD